MLLQELVAKNGSLNQVAVVATKPARDLRADALERYARANMMPLDSPERARLLAEAIRLMAQADREGGHWH